MDPRFNVAEKRQLNGEEEDDENNMDAWERSYADERYWEPSKEDESELLHSIDNSTLHHAQYRRQLRSLSTVSTDIYTRIQKGLYGVIDFSRSVSLFSSPILARMEELLLEHAPPPATLIFDSAL
ncbi:hypothetical protein Sjap_001400 [Stephania japonica]|uniref:Uncharacterized protein n=1 Tax=Stephania japonica TaxID=461633 RepID=A0AAP0KKS7_9MAGN